MAVSPLSIQCPFCRACAGEFCSVAATRRQLPNRYHPARIEAARKR